MIQLLWDKLFWYPMPLFGSPTILYISLVFSTSYSHCGWLLNIMSEKRPTFALEFHLCLSSCKFVCISFSFYYYYYFMCRNLEIVSSFMSFITECRLKKNKSINYKEKKTRSISFQYFQVNFISFSSLYRIVFLLCSIAALGTSGYFYCGCILYVFLRNNILQNVLTAVNRSGESYWVQLYSHFPFLYSRSDNICCSPWLEHSVHFCCCLFHILAQLLWQWE